MKKVLIGNHNYDEFYTPKIAVYPILKYLPKNKVIWECTDFGSSEITKVLIDNGFKVISTHKDNFDFLLDKPDFNFDIIITNPPYSLKDEFLTKCYQYKKPFALLLPLTALESHYRSILFRTYGIQVLVLSSRINYMKNTKSCWFNSSWFCWKLLPYDLIFTDLIENTTLF